VGESDPLWGKDFAYQVDRRGTVEYKNRRVRVAYLAGGEWSEIPAPVEQAIPPKSAATSSSRNSPWIRAGIFI